MERTQLKLVLQTVREIKAFAMGSDLCKTVGKNLKNKIYGPLTTILGCVHLIQPKNILLQSVEENVKLFLTVNSDNLSLKFRSQQ